MRRKRSTCTRAVRSRLLPSSVHAACRHPVLFELHAVDHVARRGAAPFTRRTAPVDMPAFMPVGTQGTVKGLTVDAVRATGAQMMLANTYHLALRPGRSGRARRWAGCTRFSGWDGPILTDSGGFQIFSLAQNTKITEEKAVVSLAHRRPPVRAVARAGRRHSRGAGQRRGDGARPRRGAAQRAAKWFATPRERTIRWARRCRDGAHARRPGAVRHRAGRARRRAARRVRPAAGRARFSRLCRRRAERRRRRRPRCIACSTPPCRRCRPTGRAT